MNICLVQPNQSAYSETFIRNHIAILNGNIHVLHGSWWPEFDRRGESLRSLYFRRHPFRKIVSLGLKLLPAALYFRIDAKWSFYPLQDEAAMKMFVVDYLESNNIDLIFAEYGVKGAIIAEIASDLSIPLVVHFHGYDAHHIPTINAFRNKYHRLFEIAKQIIVVSEPMRKALIDLGADDKKINKVPCCIDEKIFDFKGLEVRSSSLLFIGRMVDKKGPYIALEVLGKLVKVHPGIKMLMVGDGELLNTVKAMIYALNLQNNVTLLGVQTPDEVRKLMHTSRLLILPSLVSADGDMEGAPCVIMEAMASGLPVVSTLHAGIPEVISNGNDGLLSKEHDIESMYEHVLRLVTDDELWLNIATKARDKIDFEYNFSRYQELLNGIVGKAMTV